MLSTIASVVLTGSPDGASPILAYLDPGSGSMMLQVAIAGVLSAMYFLRSSLTQIKGWVATHRPGR